jgi:NADPH:quinone reductase
MKALVAPSYGPIDQLVVADVPEPSPGPGQILLRVQAAALNPLDARLVTGEMRHLFPVTHPFIVGMDAAGVVAAIGDGVTRFAIGDEVVVYTHFHPGTIAEYTLVEEGPHIARRPAGLDAVRGAALPAVSLTAECILDAGQIGTAQSVLIVGATGGVGSFTVQLAAQVGARVLATAAPTDDEYARRLGAQVTIDHTSTDTAEQARRLEPAGVDVAVDLINAGPGLAGTAAAVKPGGRLISTLMGPNSFDRGITPAYVRMTARDGQLQRLADRTAEGRLTVEVAATYPFSEAPTALAEFAAGKYTRGKVVIIVTT